MDPGESLHCSMGKNGGVKVTVWIPPVLSVQSSTFPPQCDYFDRSCQVTGKFLHSLSSTVRSPRSFFHYLETDDNGAAWTLAFYVLLRHLFFIFDHFDCDHWFSPTGEACRQRLHVLIFVNHRFFNFFHPFVRKTNFLRVMCFPLQLKYASPSTVPVPLSVRIYFRESQKFVGCIANMSVDESTGFVIF